MTSELEIVLSEKILELKKEMTRLDRRVALLESRLKEEVDDSNVYKTYERSLDSLLDRPTLRRETALWRWKIESALSSLHREPY